MEGGGFICFAAGHATSPETGKIEVCVLYNPDALRMSTQRCLTLVSQGIGEYLVRLTHGHKWRIDVSIWHP